MGNEFFEKLGFSDLGASDLELVSQKSETVFGKPVVISKFKWNSLSRAHQITAIVEETPIKTYAVYFDYGGNKFMNVYGDGVPCPKAYLEGTPHKIPHPDKHKFGEELKCLCGVGLNYNCSTTGSNENPGYEGCKWKEALW